jgi:Flp pilus assembly protein TadD
VTEDPAARRQRITALLDLRRWDEAALLASELVAAEPTDSRALYLQARAFAGAERTDEAMAAARASQAGDPTWDAPVRVEARMLLAANPMAALYTARRAVGLNPIEAANWSLLAFVAQRAGWVHEADRAAAESRRLAPTWPESLNVSGVVALKRKSYFEAEQWFRQSLALEPSDPNVLNNLALALSRQGKTTDAIDLFERSLGVDPRSGVARRNLGATVFAQVWQGWLRALLLGSIFVGLIGLTLGSMLLALTGGAGIAAATGWAAWRRRQLGDGRRSALRDYEQSRRRRSFWRRPRRGGPG